MRKIYFNLNLEMIVSADEGVSMDDIAEKIIDSINSGLYPDFDLESCGVGNIEVTDSK